MAKIITDFRELSLPEGDTFKPQSGSWCACCKGPGLYYLLNDSSCMLGDLMTGLKTDEFYFDTEPDCHYAAATYYNKHGRKYPYMIEWQQSIDANDDTLEDDDTVGNRVGTVIQSEEMKF